MHNNYFTSKENIYDMAIQLAEMNFEEKPPTDHYSKCDHIIINGTEKNYWLTSEKEIESIQSLIEQQEGTLTKNTTLKDIKKWHKTK